jgi:hypothetical protein
MPPPKRIGLIKRLAVHAFVCLDIWTLGLAFLLREVGVDGQAGGIGHWCERASWED